jgi:hypothetical protein
VAKTGIAIGIIIIVVIVIAAVYYVATSYKAPTTTTPMVTAATAPTTVAAASTTVAATPKMSTFSKKSETANASKASSVSVTAPDGVNITVTIPAGTYVSINNKSVSAYNFTLATFNIANVGSPPGYPNQTPAYGFAFEVNGQISPSITFVNSTGAPVHLTTLTHYPSTWGSWAFLGGTFNASTGAYTGGSYAIQNAWAYNATSGTMTNTQFYKPVMWIFTIGPSHLAPAAPSTTVAQPSSTTAPTTAGGYGGYGYP